MSTILEKDRQAQWRERAEQGAEGKQQKRKWAATTIKAVLTLEEFNAAKRLLKEAHMAFEGASSASSERVDCGNGTARLADARCDARRKLVEAQIAVWLDAGLPTSNEGMEALAREGSLADVARAMGYWRKRGDRVGPNTEMAKRALQTMLASLAGYYARTTVVRAA